MTFYELMTGRFFTYIIMFLYALRAGGYAWTSHWGLAIYWAFGILMVIIIEFVIPRWP